MLLRIIIIKIYFVSLSFTIQFLYTTFYFSYNMKLTFLIYKIFTEMSKKDSFNIKIQYISPTIEDFKKMFVNEVFLI
jgi:hypothetical protein